MIPIPKRIRRWIPYLDGYDVIFAVIVFGLAGFGIYLTGDSAAIALVTAVTASVGIYRLRKPDEPKRPAVRQAFKTEEESDHKDFGLRNYGPGPALYLQVEARLECSDDSEDPLIEFEPLQYPIHLQEGDFLGFIHDDRITDGGLLKELTNEASGEGYSDEMVHLYFSYVSAAEVREPVTLPNVANRDDNKILGKLGDHTETPRRMRLGEIQKHCLQKTSEHTETEISQ